MSNANPNQTKSGESVLKKNLGGGGMVAVGGILNLLFAVVSILTFTPSAFSQSPPIGIASIFAITGLIFIAAGILAYKGTKTKIMGILAVLVGLGQIVWLFTSGVLFVSGLLSFGFIFGIIGGLKVFSSKSG